MNSSLLLPVLVLFLGTSLPSNLRQAGRKYGPILRLEGAPTWNNQKIWIIPLSSLPIEIQRAFPVDTWEKISSLRVNRDMVVPLVMALEELSSTGLIAEIETFAGCYNIRDIRRKPGVLSAHAYGLSCDFLPRKKSFSPEFVAVFRKWGVCWGGDWTSWKDPMHFSVAPWECPAKKE